MSKDQLKRISDIAPVEQVVLPVWKPIKHFGEEFILHDFETRTSEMGKFYLLHVTHVETQTECLLSTGSFMVDKQLEYIDPEIDLPTMIRFVEKDRTYYIE